MPVTSVCIAGHSIPGHTSIDAPCSASDETESGIPKVLTRMRNSGRKTYASVGIVSSCVRTYVLFVRDIGSRIRAQVGHTMQASTTTMCGITSSRRRNAQTGVANWLSVHGALGNYGRLNGCLVFGMRQDVAQAPCGEVIPHTGV